MTLAVSDKLSKLHQIWYKLNRGALVLVAYTYMPLTAWVLIEISACVLVDTCFFYCQFWQPYCNINSLTFSSFPHQWVT